MPTSDGLFYHLVGGIQISTKIYPSYVAVGPETKKVYSSQHEEAGTAPALGTGVLGETCLDEKMEESENDDGEVGVKENGSRNAFGTEVEEMVYGRAGTVTVADLWEGANGGLWVEVNEGEGFCSFCLFHRVGLYSSSVDLRLCLEEAGEASSPSCAGSHHLSPSSAYPPPFSSICLSLSSPPPTSSSGPPF